MLRNFGRTVTQFENLVTQKISSKWIHTLSEGYLGDVHSKIVNQKRVQWSNKSLILVRNITNKRRKPYLISNKY